MSPDCVFRPLTLAVVGVLAGTSMISMPSSAEPASDQVLREASLSLEVKDFRKQCGTRGDRLSDDETSWKKTVVVNDDELELHGLNFRAGKYGGLFRTVFVNKTGKPPEFLVGTQYCAPECGVPRHDFLRVEPLFADVEALLFKKHNPESGCDGILDDLVIAIPSNKRIPRWRHTSVHLSIGGGTDQSYGGSLASGFEFKREKDRTILVVSKKFETKSPGRYFSGELLAEIIFERAFLDKTEGSLYSMGKTTILSANTTVKSGAVMRVAPTEASNRIATFSEGSRLQIIDVSKPVLRPDRRLMVKCRRNLRWWKLRDDAGREGWVWGEDTHMGDCYAEFQRRHDGDLMVIPAKTESAPRTEPAQKGAH